MCIISVFDLVFINQICLFFLAVLNSTIITILISEFFVQVYEPKFNTNLFATLLNIPPTKTLLRRHLATHFRHIVGDELMQIKREKETEMPLSPSVKVKVIL